MQKLVSGNYILAVGRKINGIEIGEEEYGEILTAMNNKPEKEGFYYKLRDDNKQWDEFEIMPDPTPIDEEIQQKAEAFDYPTEQDNNIKNKILNIYTNIEEWKNPKDTGNPYNKSDKCYYKEQFWVSTVDNNISEPGGLANTWINI